MKKLILAVLLEMIIAPHSTYAAVVINEIAWMGAPGQSNNEWIELYNNGTETVDLTDWKLSISSKKDILLAHAIAGGAYYLIERTDDNSVPGVPADLVASFGRGLANTGETLKLKNVQGDVMDSVVGGANWARVGGDVATGKTAQRMQAGQSGKWTTAVPTPRAENAHSAPLERAASDTVAKTTAVAIAPVRTPTYPTKISRHKKNTALDSQDAPVADAQIGVSSSTYDTQLAAAGAAAVVTHQIPKTDSTSYEFWLGLAALVVCAGVVGIVALRATAPTPAPKSIADEIEIIDISEEDPENE